MLWQYTSYISFTLFAIDWEGSLEHALEIKTKHFQHTIPTKTKEKKKIYNYFYHMIKAWNYKRLG